jgi:AcrR family transcriptional regulator
MTKVERESPRDPSPARHLAGQDTHASLLQQQRVAAKRRAKLGATPTLPGKARKRDANATRARILESAMEEFAARGLPDARIEDVALRAGANRRMIYYYFGSKEGLYLAALEAVYAELMEEERKIDVEKLDPIEAITALVRLKIDHYTRYPRFIAFLNMENLYKARHLKNSKRLADFKAPLTEIIARVLERGQRLGLFRKGIDPVDLYISICALGYLYFSNQYTLSVIFGRKLISPKALENRKITIADFVTSYLVRGSEAGERRKARRRAR